MERFVLLLGLIGLLINDPLSLWNPEKNLWAQNTAQYSLQVATLPTKISAQKEIGRLKAYKIQAQSVPWEDRTNKTWFVIYIPGYQTQEEATRHGNQLIQNGIIKSFRASLVKAKEETPPRVEKPTLPPKPAAKKEPIPISGNSPVYVGPIFSDETKEDKPALVKESPPVPSTSFNLQVASFSSLKAAQKEIERLKSFLIKAKYTLGDPQSKKKIFIIYLDHFKSQEEATRKGNQLVQKKIIKTFKVLTQKAKEETTSSKTKEGPPAPLTPSKKEPSPSPDKNPIYFGTISIKEEETAIRINISLDRKIFPEISAEKTAGGSRLIVTFKNVDRYIVPIEFEKIQSNLLLSFSLTKKGADCIFNILLNSKYNYEVTQNYFEKEKLYSLVLGREPVTAPPPEKKE